MSAESKDWSDLPPELIHLISKKLADLADFVRFRAVCKSWCSSAPLLDPPPQMPWLLECSCKFLGPTQLKEELRFYSLFTGKIGTLSVKESCRGMPFEGPGSGYLLSVFEGRVLLLNPLTNAEISLPSLPEHIRNSCFWLIWSGSGPILSRDIAFLNWDFQSPEQFGAVYHPGSTEWSLMEGWKFLRSCYWNGMLFTTKGYRNTRVFDVTTQKLLCETQSPEEPSFHRKPSYLVEMSGVIILVCRNFSPKGYLESSSFHLYELHFEEKEHRKPFWVKVSNIGDHMLFMDEVRCFALKPIAGFKGNSIYFLSPFGISLYKYDIATDTTEMLPCPFESCTWFLPSLQ